ncbi:MAG: cation diffusion facilitator family transporter [Propionibacteriaceae bacterium]|jgi:cation diffusion facilitator family transporter|nr:cation diffusion facilitator family transporter [Propionibacteriaceae bacterium]
MAHSSGTKAVVAAMSANLAIAVMKLVAFLLTRASSMLAEAIHSFADCANQVLLLLGGRSAQKQATPLHPFGYGRARYLSAFLVSIILFSMGGLFALYEAYHKLEEVRAGHPNELLNSSWWWVPLAVLGGAIIAESLSLRTAVIESRPHKGSTSWARFIKSSKSPELPVILLEDIAALLGLVFALIGVGMTIITKWAGWDVIGTVAIGILLICVAVVLAAETRSLLIGEAASDEEIEKITTAMTGTAGIQSIIHMKTIHLGPEEVLVAAKVEVDADATAKEVAEILNSAEAAVRQSSAVVGPMYLEPDLRRDEGDTSVSEEVSTTSDEH